MSSHLTHSARSCDRRFTAFHAAEDPRVEGFPPALRYPPGVELFRQGDDIQEVFLVEDGLVKLLQLQHDGEEVIVGLRSSGWFLGASTAILGGTHAVTAIAVTSVTVSRIRAPSFLQMVRAEERLSWRLHQMHCREIQAQITHMANLISLPARDRLRHFLGQLIPVIRPTPSSDRVRVEIPLKQREIAHLIGVTPQYLSQLFAVLEDEGWLHRQGHSIVMRDASWTNVASFRLCVDKGRIPLR